MKLPDLPRQLNKREAEVTPRVINWFEKNYPRSVAVEIKVGKNKTKSHQDLALKEVQDGVFSYKIPDLGRKNPFDFFTLKNADAFVVTCNLEERECHAVSPSGTSFIFEI